MAKRCILLMIQFTMCFTHYTILFEMSGHGSKSQLESQTCSFLGLSLLREYHVMFCKMVFFYEINNALFPKNKKVIKFGNSWPVNFTVHALIAYFTQREKVILQVVFKKKAVN